MTNLDIEKAFDELFAFRHYTPGSLSDDEAFERAARTAPTKENVLRVARALVLEAYRQAAQLACIDCMNGRAVEERDENWYHPAASYWPEGRCRAGAIYARIESLSAAP